MAKVTFQGLEDVRVLGSEDLEKAGVSGFEETAFARHIETEVSDEVAAALINNPSLYGSFSVMESGPDPIPGTDSGSSTEKASKSNKSKAD